MMSERVPKYIHVNQYLKQIEFEDSHMIIITIYLSAGIYKDAKGFRHQTELSSVELTKLLRKTILGA